MRNKSSKIKKRAYNNIGSFFMAKQYQVPLSQKWSSSTCPHIANMARKEKYK